MWILKGYSPSSSAATPSKTKVKLHLHHKSQQGKSKQGKRIFFLHLRRSTPPQAGSPGRPPPVGPRPAHPTRGSPRPLLPDPRSTAARGWAGRGQAALRKQHAPLRGFSRHGWADRGNFFHKTHRLFAFSLPFPFVCHTRGARAFLLLLLLHLRQSVPSSPCGRGQPGHFEPHRRREVAAGRDGSNRWYRNPAPRHSQRFGRDPSARQHRDGSFSFSSPHRPPPRIPPSPPPPRPQRPHSPAPGRASAMPTQRTHPPRCAPRSGFPAAAHAHSSRAHPHTPHPLPLPSTGRARLSARSRPGAWSASGRAGGGAGGRGAASGGGGGGGGRE